MIEFLKKQNNATKWSAVALFFLLASLQMLRAVKDTMAIEAKLDNLQFLVTGTFVMIIVLTFISGKTIKSSLYLLTSLMVAGLLLYTLFLTPSPYAPAMIFVLIGSFSLILISQFWKSLMRMNDFRSGVDHYGFIAITGSIGGILGPIISVLVIRGFGVSACIFFAIILLIAANVGLAKANSQSSDYARKSKYEPQQTGNNKAMLWISAFIFIYALLSTFIYVKQLDIVSEFAESIDQRIILFSFRDLAIGLVLVLFQFYTIKRPRTSVKPKIAAFPLITLFLFLVISIIPTLGAVMLAIVIFRSYNYAIVRPARELFYLKSPGIGTMKNSIDAILYRTGDLLAIWLIYLMKSIGLWQWAVLLIIVPIVLIWSFVSTKIQYEIKPTS